MPDFLRSLRTAISLAGQVFERIIATARSSYVFYGNTQEGLADAQNLKLKKGGREDQQESLTGQQCLVLAMGSRTAENQWF